MDVFANIWILMTVLMGAPHGMSIHNTQEMCQASISSHKAMQLMDTSNMTCVEYIRKK